MRCPPSFQVRPERAIGVSAIVACTHLHKRTCVHRTYHYVAAFKMRRDSVTKKMLLPGALRPPSLAGRILPSPPTPHHPTDATESLGLAGLGFVPSAGSSVVFWSKFQFQLISSPKINTSCVLLAFWPLIFIPDSLKCISALAITQGAEQIGSTAINTTKQRPPFAPPPPGSGSTTKTNKYKQRGKAKS